MMRTDVTFKSGQAFELSASIRTRWNQAYGNSTILLRHPDWSQKIRVIRNYNGKRTSILQSVSEKMRRQINV